LLQIKGVVLNTAGEIPAGLFTNGYVGVSAFLIVSSDGKNWSGPSDKDDRRGTLSLRPGTAKEFRALSSAALPLTGCRTVSVLSLGPFYGVGWDFQTVQGGGRIKRAPTRTAGLGLMRRARMAAILSIRSQLVSLMIGIFEMGVPCMACKSIFAANFPIDRVYRIPMRN